MTAEKPSFGFFGAHPYRNMFFAMAAILVAAVVLPEEIIGGRLYDYMVTGILLVALVETTRSRRHGIIALLFGVPAIGARLAFSYSDDTVAINSTVLGLSALFFAFLIWNLLRDLLMGHRSTSERVFGALTAYLCIGILFALIFAHIQYRDPEAFRIPEYLLPGSTQSEALMVPVFTYFSFVTMTTLGYGDVVPITEQARSIAWMEAIIGQLFLAVMVGGLVGIFFADAAQRAGRDGNVHDSSEGAGSRDDDSS